jgi:hypothetical protein
LGEKKACSCEIFIFHQHIFICNAHLFRMTYYPKPSKYTTQSYRGFDVWLQKSWESSDQWFIYLFIFVAKRQQTLQHWQTYNRGLGLQFAKGRKGFIKTHRPHTKSQRRVWDKMNFPVLFIFHWIYFFQRIELGFWLMVKIWKKREFLFYFIFLCHWVVVFSLFTITSKSPSCL